MVEAEERWDEFVPSFAGAEGEQPTCQHPNVLHQQPDSEQKMERRIARIGQDLDLAQPAVGSFNPEAPTVFNEDLTGCPVKIDQNESAPLALRASGFGSGSRVSTSARRAHVPSVKV